MRVLVLWCPDWPVVAALTEAGRSTRLPAAVVAANRVEACNAAARAESVRRGQRRRDAQARCPELLLLPAGPERDVRLFEPVLAAVEQLRPGVAPIRPGLLAVRSPGRYFGGEEHAAAVVAERVVEQGVRECRVGIADDLFTAEQAARRAALQEACVVPAGGSPDFLRELPVGVLESEGQAGQELVSLVRRLGLHTLGDLAGLPHDAVLGRFGRYGAEVWQRVRGDGLAAVAGRTPPPELEAEVAFEPPLDSVEAICFSVRTTAERFVATLAERSLVATAVRVEAEVDGTPGQPASARTWLHPRHFGSRDLVDRVHWQLQAAASSGLRSAKAAGEVSAPVSLVRFVPETVEPAAAHAEGLWGGSVDDQVERGVSRVQAMVGFDAVVRPVRQGGRSPAARQAEVVWGERAVGLRPVDRPWPGRVPGPPPVRVFTTPLGVEVVDEAGRSVKVSERGVVVGEPVRFRMTGTTARATALPWQPVSAWAGPWPVDEGWWGGESEGQHPGPCARFQVVGVDGRAWLLVRDPAGWHVEAAYD